MIMKIGRALHKRAKGEKGFTLIELIVVIAVLGVLATLVVPRVVNIKGEAEKNTKAANEKIIRNALERYNATEGTYPNDLATLEGKYLDKDYSKEWEYSKSGDTYTLTEKKSDS